MDFFGAQERARRRTWQLGALFVAAVVTLVIATNVLVALVAAFTTTQGVVSGVEGAVATTSVETWLAISAAVVFVIAAASLYKYFAIRSGGRAIAELLAARQIDPSTTDLRERRALNVVEEMAIASGVPVPPVYLIEEPGINAFAAGLGADDAIIGVTRGTLLCLDRDELQGVIAHEFSHILNGDSLINLRLIAILHGILFLSLLGEMLLRSGRGNRRGNPGAPVLILGLGLLIIGYAGNFFGNLIKAAVSRQREYLADAASVQFTRNPAGIADALKKIGGSPAGSHIGAPHTREMSHLFFGQAVSFLINGLFATHPPLESRIRAIEPRWDGRFISGAPDAEPLELPESASAIAQAGSPPVQAARPAVADVVVAQVGNPDARSVAAAEARIRGFDVAVVAELRDRASACSFILALFLSPDSDVRDRQLNLLRISSDERSALRVIDAYSRVTRLDDVERLTAVTMAAPALKGMSSRQYHHFMADIVALVRADERIDLNEWVLHRLLTKALAAFYQSTPTRRRPLPREEEDAALTIVLSALARAGRTLPGSAERAFAIGADAVGRSLAFDDRDDADFERLNAALRALRGVPPLRKPSLIKACAACALADGVEPAERALLAGIAATIDCPLPPDFRIDVE